MGRNNKQYSKTLHEQAYDRLVSMQAFGESKRKSSYNFVSLENKGEFNFSSYIKALNEDSEKYGKNKSENEHRFISKNDFLGEPKSYRGGRGNRGRGRCGNRWRGR